MPTRTEAPRPRPVRGIALERAASGRGAGGGSGGQPPHVPESSLSGTGQRAQPNASRPREGAPKSSRRHVGFSLGLSLGLSSSNGLRRRGPLRGARGGGPSAGCMKRRFGGERLLSIVAATIAIISAGAVAIAEETVA